MYTLILLGRRSVQLQKCHNLRLPFNPFSTSSVTLDVRSKDSLKVKTLPVFEKLLRSYKFTESQISNIIRVYPQLLVLDAESSIAPKLKFLKSREGVSTSELTEVLSKVPQIFGIKREKTTSVYYDFAKEIIVADKSSTKLSHLLVEGSKQGNKMRNVMVLRELGVPRKVLFSLLISNNRVCCGKEKFEESLKKVVEMGFNPRTAKFVEALQVVQRLSEKTIEEKVNVWKRLGFVEGDVWKVFKKCPITLARSERKILDSVELFVGLGFSREEFVMIVKRSPACVGLAEETVKEKNEFIVGEMKWKLKALVSHPQVFNYSMEKRIVPRCNVVKALMSKGLLGGKHPSMSAVLARTEQGFLNRYVKMHGDKKLVAELMAIFTGNRVL